MGDKTQYFRPGVLGRAVGVAGSAVHGVLAADPVRFSTTSPRTARSLTLLGPQTPVLGLQELELIAVCFLYSAADAVSAAEPPGLRAAAGRTDGAKTGGVRLGRLQYPDQFVVTAEVLGLSAIPAVGAADIVWLGAAASRADSACAGRACHRFLFRFLFFPVSCQLQGGFALFQGGRAVFAVGAALVVRAAAGGAFCAFAGNFMDLF